MHTPSDSKKRSLFSKRCRLRRHDRRGASAVEFAVVSPFLFLLLLGMMEFGRVLTVQQILTTAARTAAREAVLPGATTATVTSAAQSMLTASAFPLPAATISCSTDPATATPGSMISVTVSTPISGISTMGKTWFGPSFQVATSATMRKEGLQ